MKKLHFGYLVVTALILTCFIPLSLGLSCAGIFYPPLSEALGIDKGILSYYTSVLWISALVTLPLMGKLLAEKDARVCLTAAVAIMACAFVWLSFTQYLWQFFVAAAAMGMGVGMLLFLAPSTLINRWFAKRGGFLLGICMAFTGIGGMMWSTVGGILIDTIGWSSTYLVFALLSAATIPATLFMIASNPEKKSLLPYGAEELKSESSSTSPSPTSAPSSTPSNLGIKAKQAYKMPVFYAILAMCFCLNIAMPVYFMIPSYASALDIGIALPLLGATASSVAMGGQTFSKLILGAVGEKTPARGTIAALCCGIIGSLLFAFVSVSIPFYYAAALLFGIYYGITNVMMPIFTRASFGDRDYAKIYSRVSMIASISNAAGAFVWGTVVTLTSSYAIMFVGAAALMLITCMLVLIISRMHKTTTDSALTAEQSI